jgi:hypothetical protein
MNRDMKPILDIDEDETKLVYRGHMELLIFDSVSHCLIDKIALSGPSTLNDLDDNCKAYDQLCKGAMNVASSRRYYRPCLCGGLDLETKSERDCLIESSGPEGSGQVAMIVAQSSGCMSTLL